MGSNGFVNRRSAVQSRPPAQETHAQRVYRYRRAFRGVIELFGREYDRALVNRRGFAAMAPDRLREVSAAGGRRRHELGVGHYFTPDEAREAGRKGGNARRRKAPAVAQQAGGAS